MPSVVEFGRRARQIAFTVQTNRPDVLYWRVKTNFTSAMREF